MAVYNSGHFTSASVVYAVSLLGMTLLSTVSDDPADAVRSPPSSKAPPVHLRLKRKISPTARSAHVGFPRPRHQKAFGGARHLPASRGGDGELRIGAAVRHAD